MLEIIARRKLSHGLVCWFAFILAFSVIFLMFVHTLMASRNPLVDIHSDPSASWCVGTELIGKIWQKGRLAKAENTPKLGIKWGKWPSDMILCKCRPSKNVRSAIEWSESLMCKISVMSFVERNNREGHTGRVLRSKILHLPLPVLLSYIFFF